MDEGNSDNYKREVGLRLRSARIAAGITTMREAADLLSQRIGKDIETSRISNYENGHRLPDPQILIVLCKIYDASASQIYGFEEAPRNKRERALLDVYRSTDDRGRRAIYSVAESQPAYLADVEAPDDEINRQGSKKKAG